MNKQNKEYLKRSCEMIETMLPLSAAEMVQWYEHHGSAWRTEIDHDLVYCLFSLPALAADGSPVKDAAGMHDSPIEQIFLFVYDQDTLIANVRPSTVPCRIFYSGSQSLHTSVRTMIGCIWHAMR